MKYIEYSNNVITLLYTDDACGPYGHDIHLQEICAAWKRPPVTEMSVQEYGQWMKVEQQLRELKKQKDLEQMRKFREMVTKPHRHHRTKTEEKDEIDKILPHETNLYDYPMTSTRGNLGIHMCFPL